MGDFNYGWNDTEPTPTPTEVMPSYSIYVGVVISICGNILISVALNLQKYTHNKNERAKVHTPYVKRPMWWLGMSLMLLGKPPPALLFRLLLLNAVFFLSFLFSHFLLGELGCPSSNSSSSLPSFVSSPPQVSVETSWRTPLPQPQWWPHSEPLPLSPMRSLPPLPSRRNFALRTWQASSSPLAVQFWSYVSRQKYPFSSLFPSLSNPIGSQVIFSASTAEVYTVEQLVEALGETKFIVYVCLTFVGLVALLFLSPRYGKKFLAIDMLIVGIFGQFFSSHFFFCLISLI